MNPRFANQRAHNAREREQRLLSDIAQSLVRAVICTEISRLSRSEIDFLGFFELCEKYDVKMISLREQFDTTSAAGRLILRQFSSFAQYEREQISERTSLNLLARAKRGLWNGGLLYGYAPRPNQTGYLDILESEAVIVRLIFCKYLELGSYVAVTAWLNAQGYRTREYTSKRGVLHSARLWGKTTVSDILSNIAYIGKRLVLGEVVRGVWQPIIDEDIFGHVQKLLAKNRASNHSHNASDHVYLLSGLLHCSHCALPMESGSGTGRSKIYFYYRHPAKRRKSDCPCPIALPAQKIEKLICQELLRLLDDSELIEMACNQVSAHTKTDLENMQREVALLDKQISDITSTAQNFIQKLELLTYDQAKEFIQPRLDQMLTQKKALTDRRQELFAQVLALKDVVIEPSGVRGMLEVVLTQLDELDDLEKKRLMELIFARIEIFVDSLQVGIRAYKNFDIDEAVRVGTAWLPETGATRTVFLLHQPQVNQYVMCIAA